MRIAYFSPLSPIKSGISQYSERELLPYLRKKCSIDIIVDEGYKPNSKFIKENFIIKNFRNFENDYDNILYHMGNNLFHLYMYEIAIKNPGIIVLHDPFIHHLILLATVGKSNALNYVKILKYCVGLKGSLVAVKAFFTYKFPLFDYPLVKEIVDSSAAVIVHSDYAYKIVKKEAPDALVKKIKMPISIPKQSIKNNIREELKIPQDFTIIVTFGYIASHKRLCVCLKCFARYHKNNPKSIFLLVGSYQTNKYRNEIHELVKVLNITDSFIETGYVDNLFPYVEISDIITQLRYPTAGETSIITLQIMGIGKPIIISKSGSFEELSDNSVIKIEHNESEEVSLYNAFMKLTNDIDFRQALSSHAKRYVEEEHNPEKIAEQFYDFLLAVPKIKPKKHSSIISKKDPFSGFITIIKKIKSKFKKNII